MKIWKSRRICWIKWKSIFAMSFQSDRIEEKVGTDKLFHVRYLLDFLFIQTELFFSLWKRNGNVRWKKKIWRQNDDHSCRQSWRHSTNFLDIINIKYWKKKVLKTTGELTFQRMSWYHVAPLSDSKLNCNRFKIKLRERFIYELDNLHIFHNLEIISLKRGLKV